MSHTLTQQDINNKLKRLLPLWLLIGDEYALPLAVSDSRLACAQRPGRSDNDASALADKYKFLAFQQDIKAKPC